MKHYTNTELSRILADIKAGRPYAVSYTHLTLPTK